jgi:hypothetical protein
VLLLFFFALFGFPLHVVYFFFTLFGSPLHIVVLLFDCSYILGTRFFTLLPSFSCNFVVLFELLLLVCCNPLKNLVLPPCIPSCRNWEWLRINNGKLVFFQ